MSRAGVLRTGLCVAGVLALAACNESGEPVVSEPRPVRVVTIETSDLGEVVAISGDVQAAQEVARSFRIAGRLAERPVNVGDAVAPDQLLARLEPEIEENAVRGALATVVAAEGQVTTARDAFDRQAQLLERGFTTRTRYEEAQEGLRAAEAQLTDAQAQLEIAEDRLAFVELRAGGEGIVTARGAEPGEVVSAGQMIVRIARDDGRDAVFDVPARLLHAVSRAPDITVRLAEDAAVTAVGRVREIAPEADAATGTFRIRVGLDDPPAGLRLGATVVGEVALSSAVVVAMPASALTRQGRHPAVWVVEPETSKVALRPIEILAFSPGSVTVSSGLHPAEVIVTAGTQALHPGQTVAPLPAGGRPSTQP